mmetsp:Transcript_24392/g.33432  ORF Transcript_24392/g.33432 Transcript_24392/m.33432 type:complete len:214 (+) Transcript_24392:3086-3727(+)
MSADARHHALRLRALRRVEGQAGLPGAGRNHHHIAQLAGGGVGGLRGLRIHPLGPVDDEPVQVATHTQRLAHSQKRAGAVLERPVRHQWLRLPARELSQDEGLALGEPAPLEAHRDAEAAGGRSHRVQGLLHQLSPPLQVLQHLLQPAIAGIGGVCRGGQVLSEQAQAAGRGPDPAGRVPALHQLATQLLDLPLARVHLLAAGQGLCRGDEFG